MGRESNVGGGEADDATLSPDEAFAAIGHDIRIRILEALATTDRANRPLSFSDLRKQVGTIDSAQFNYHLDKLVGHFVERSDEGYDLYRAGGRIAEAVLSGAVTEDPRVEHTEIDRRCHYCGANVEVAYRQERLEAYCTECAGTYGKSNTQEDTDDVPYEYGFLGNLNLPPVGLQDRTLTDVYDAATAWSLAERKVAAGGMCPRCSATLEEDTKICEDHDPDGGCDNCNSRYGILHEATCTNCVFGQRVAFGLFLFDNTDLQAFLTGHGINLVTPEQYRYASVVMDYEEELLGMDPFEARFTFTADGDAITLTVDEDFEVVEVEIHDADGS